VSIAVLPVPMVASAPLARRVMAHIKTIAAPFPKGLTSTLCKALCGIVVDRASFMLVRFVGHNALQMCSAMVMIDAMVFTQATVAQNIPRMILKEPPQVLQPQP